MLKKVISGGQTGADHAGLEAARIVGILTGGWMPKGFITTHGPAPVIAERYQLNEHDGGYRERTYANVHDSDGTLRLAHNFGSPGEICTARACFEYNKPRFDVLLWLPQTEDATYRRAIDWMRKYNIETLNVAGNSETTSPGIYDIALEILIKLFTLALDTNE